MGRWRRHGITIHGRARMVDDAPASPAKLRFWTDEMVQEKIDPMTDEDKKRWLMSAHGEGEISDDQVVHFFYVYALKHA